MNILRIMFILFFLLCATGTPYSQNVNSKIHIVSEDEYKRDVSIYDIGTTSNTSSRLLFSRSELSYYNSCYFDKKKSDTILYEDFTINVSLKHIEPRSSMYFFEIPIRNLNAEAGYKYFSEENPKLKQNVDDIYWGFKLNITHNGIDESILIWLKMDSKDFYGRKVQYVSYNINQKGWKETIAQYPDPSYETKLKIISDKYQKVSGISWGNIDFFSKFLNPLPYYIDAINSIQVLVGCQADVKIGKGELDLGNYMGLAYEYIYKFKDYLESHYNTLSEFIEAEKFFSAKTEAKKYIQRDGSTTEFNAFNLAFCQLNMEEFNDCIETCNALIIFRGDYLKQAFLFRGIAKEAQGDIKGALSDYINSGSIGEDFYTNLNQKKSKK